jgi:hypothetical protein
MTWASGTMGVQGIVSATNSLVGSSPNDQVGSDLFGNANITLLNNDNYLVRSPHWSGNRGAVTWGSGMTGISGVVSDTNSLVGTNTNDQVGSGVTVLANGNYVIQSPSWNGNRGAVTWVSGTTPGIHAAVSDANSLVGTNTNDQVGQGGITLLSNGNYLVASKSWNGNRGAVTWASGDTGVTGAVSAANSLIGNQANDFVGSDQFGRTSLIALNNDNYVVSSLLWNGSRGAVTWGSGTTGVSGDVSDTNSLVGTDPNDQVGSAVTVLSISNYVIQSPSWSGNRGAVTWGDGTMGVSGLISNANSLVGTNTTDRVGYDGITALSNGNYLARSPFWSESRGAVTWGSGATGVRGAVSADNSLVGSNPGDGVGTGFSRFTLLSDGNYVIASPSWNSNRGAATWGSGSAGVSGVVSDTNSLVGSSPNDRVSGGGIIVLSSNNYLVASPSWNGFRGAATWGSGTAGVSGAVSDANSLVGSSLNDQVGSGFRILTNGNYLVTSTNWNASRGAVTWGSAMTGVTGAVSEANSLVGGNPNDLVGAGAFFVALSNGNFVVCSPNWNQARGAATWGNGSTGVSGVVSDANSLVGSDPGDIVSDAGISVLSNGNFVVHSALHHIAAVTWGSATTGVSGVVSDANSIVGIPGDSTGRGLAELGDGNFLVVTVNFLGGRDAVTWVNGSTGKTLDGRGFITAQNSVFGSNVGGDLQFLSIVVDRIHGSFLLAFGQDGGGHLRVGFVGPNQLTYALAQAQTITITPDFLTQTLNTGTAVLLQASNDITIEDPIHVDAGGNGGALTLQAGRSILINASITTDNGALTLIANDTLADGVVDAQRDPGNAFITIAGGTVLDTGTGPLNIELRNGAGLTNNSSRAINLQSITAGSATIINNGPSAGSDIRLETVTTNGPQSYSNPHGTTTVAGYLLAGGSQITFTDSVTVNASVTVGFDGDTVDFAGSGTQTLQSASGSRFSNFAHTGNGTLRLTGGLSVIGSFIDAAGTFDANDQTVTVSGLAQITDGAYLAGTARQNFHGGLVLRGGIFTSSTGPMTVTGPIAVLNGILSGQGTLESVTGIGGTLAPSPGILSVAGSVTLFASTTFSVTLNGIDPGSYSQVSASGPVNLGGSTLELTLGFAPQVGDAFTLLSSAFGPITGTFAGLEEGATFMQDGILFQITYQGGPDSQSVVLTRLA